MRASFPSILLLFAFAQFPPNLQAQTPDSPPVISVPAATAPANPIAIVPLDSGIPGSASIVTGALQVMNGRAFITTNGTISSGTTTTQVSLPQRGSLQVCASTTVKIAADSSVPAGEIPGILLAMDHGAIEASFATGRNADTILTPDFRILIGAPGTANVKVRLGQGGDTCVDNPVVPGNRPADVEAPYVLVTSVFDGSIYRVQAGQRVMFQHGSLREVVDQEKEPCGCPPPAVKGNDFPLAQSEGLAPVSPAPAAKVPPTTQPLVFNAGDSSSSSGAATPQPAPASAPTQTAPHKRSGLFARMGHFFRRLFGAE
jgi:hypothetical protein